MPKQEAAQHIEVVPTPHQASVPQRKPFVMFLQGTAGGNARAELWSNWFNAQGVSAVIIDSASLRGRNHLNGVDSYHLSKDISLALDVLKDRTDLDFSRYAVMGFSRGATAALQAGSNLTSQQFRPQFIFSLYPGGAGQCPNTYTDATRVLVFYGELDESGTRNGNRDRCRRMTEQSANAAYHGFADAYHGFDSMITSVARDGAGSYTIRHNQRVVEQTRQIIQRELHHQWPDVVR